MRVLVCGGRNYRNVAHVWRELDALHAETPIVALMQGGANGADKAAHEWVAIHKDVQGYVCRAEWGKYGPSAGPRRNARMLEWSPDVILAFPGGTGTADMVNKAKDAGIKVIEK